MGERCKLPHAHAHQGLGRSPTAGANAFLMHKTTETLCNYFHAYERIDCLCAQMFKYPVW